jgi:hypothetical protein
MTFNWIIKEFVAPAFFFLSVALMALSAHSIYEAITVNAHQLVLACAFFIPGWIAGRVGLRMLGTIART